MAIDIGPGTVSCVQGWKINFWYILVYSFNQIWVGSHRQLLSMSNIQSCFVIIYELLKHITCQNRSTTRVVTTNYLNYFGAGSNVNLPNQFKGKGSEFVYNILLFYGKLISVRLEQDDENQPTNQPKRNSCFNKNFFFFENIIFYMPCSTEHLILDKHQKRRLRCNFIINASVPYASIIPRFRLMSMNINNYII